MERGQLGGGGCRKNDSKAGRGGGREGGRDWIGLDCGCTISAISHAARLDGRRAAAVDAGAPPVTLGWGLLRLCCGPLHALLLLLLLLCLDDCADPASAPHRVCLRCCGWRLGGWVRGLAPDSDTRAPTVYTASQAFLLATMYFPWCCWQRGLGLSTQQRGTCWGPRAGFVLVVGWCFVVVLWLICRARGVVPAHGLGDPSGVTDMRLLGGPTGRGREGGICIWIWGPILRLTGCPGYRTMALPTTLHIGWPCHMLHTQVLNGPLPLVPSSCASPWQR